MTWGCGECGRRPFHESMKLQTAHNELPLFLIKDMNQLKTNLHIINPKPKHSTINNQQENLHYKANSQKIIPNTIGTGSIQNRCTQHQPNQSTRHQISFRLVSLVRKLSLFAVSLPPCHSARSWKRRRRIHHPKNNPRALGEGERRRGWVRFGEEHIPPPLIRPEGLLFPERSLSFAYWDSGFCNSGQALRAEWHESEVRDWKKKPIH